MCLWSQARVYLLTTAVNGMSAFLAESHFKSMTYLSVSPRSPTSVSSP